MTHNRVRLIAITLFVLPVVAIAAYSPQTVTTLAADDDSAAVYKAKCAVCHSPKAEKAFDPAKPVADHVETVLKGKKGEKPPFMPGFEAKGMTKEQATALVEYMVQLRQPPK
jgi:mono/diheme cytochrome c family protein